MEKLYITHYYYPGTDPWKNIMLLTEEEAFQKAEELASLHPNTTSFGRFADFKNYYPARKKADEFVRERFIGLGGNPKLEHPFSFSLMECEYLKEWFNSSDKITINLEDIPDDQVSFTLGDSCALMIHGKKPVVLTKKMLLEQIAACSGSVKAFCKESLGKYAYVEVQLWDRIQTESGSGEEIVETERLIMRRLRPDDYLAMAAWDMDERVYKYLLGSACKTPEDPLVWLPKKDPTSKINILMLVMDKRDGHAVGIYALNHDIDRDVWTLSYVNRFDDWGKGYTAEGMKALMDHAVNVYGARFFEGECAKENVGSIKVMQKLGMIYDHSSSYSKNDGSATFESDVYVLQIDK